MREQQEKEEKRREEEREEKCRQLEEEKEEKHNTHRWRGFCGRGFPVGSLCSPPSDSPPSTERPPSMCVIVIFLTQNYFFISRNVTHV